MRFTFFRRRKKAVPELGEDGLPVDRITWKDTFEMLQLYKVTPRTLRRWRQEYDVDFYKHKKQIYYNNEQVQKLFKKGGRPPKKEYLLKWPFKWFPTGVILLLLAIFSFSGSTSLSSYYVVIVALILLLTGIVLLIQKIWKKPKV
jgi:hypothetical protein